MPGDASEREADRIAEEVLSAPQHDAPHAPAHSIPNAPAHRDTSAGARAIQPKHAQGAARSAAQESATALSSMHGGEPLPSSSREFFEARFGRDFGGVRIHTGASAAESARSLSARAYTVGSDVVFGEREYAPETDAGRRLLAHELTHVVQQSSREKLIQRETITGCTDPEQIHVTDAVTHAYSDLGTVLTLMDWQPKDKTKKQETDKDKQKEYRPSVKNAMWLAFRTDDPGETENVANRLANLKGGITSAEYKCVREGTAEHLGNCKPTEDAFVTRESPDRHSKRSGPIHLCTPNYFLQSDAEQARIVIHEAAHRFLNVPDTGYFLPGCAESPHAAGTPADDAESGTSGDNPSIRLDNADAYACFVHFLTRIRRQDLKDRAESARGAGLQVEYAELAGEGSVVYTQTGSPGVHTYQITGGPPNSGFRYRWYLESGTKTYPLESAFGSTVNAAVFSETNTRVIIPNSTRRALASDGATSGKLVCEFELFSPAAGGQAARAERREYSVTISDAIDPSSPPAQQSP